MPNSRRNGYGSSYQSRRRRINWGAWGIVGVVILVIAGIVGYQVLYSTTQHTESCQVTGKDRSIKLSSSGGDHPTTTSTTDYRVYTSNCGTLSVSDDFFRGKFNSSDTYGQIREDRTYQMEIIGFRNGFFSIFPNILSAQEIK